MPMGIIVAVRVAFLRIRFLNAIFVATTPELRSHWLTGESIYTVDMLRVPLRWFMVVALTTLVTVAGCRSPQVQVTVVNSGNTELHNIEVDYSYASFGIPSLAPGADFHYKLKLVDAGRMKVEFSDNHKQQHSGKGPYTTEGQHGTVTISLDGSGKNTWTANLQPVIAAPKDE